MSFTKRPRAAAHGHSAAVFGEVQQCPAPTIRRRINHTRGAKHKGHAVHLHEGCTEGERIVDAGAPPPRSQQRPGGPPAAPPPRSGAPVAPRSRSRGVAAPVMQQRPHPRRPPPPHRRSPTPGLLSPLTERPPAVARAKGDGLHVFSLIVCRLGAFIGQEQASSACARTMANANGCNVIAFHVWLRSNHELFVSSLDRYRCMPWGTDIRRGRHGRRRSGLARHRRPLQTEPPPP